MKTQANEFARGDRIWWRCVASPEMEVVAIGDELVSVPKLMKAMQHAQFIASLYSKDPRTKVAALILRDDWSPVSWGYNGFPRGTREPAELWENREAKYRRVLHAESNAIDTARQDLRGTTIVCTLFPCSNCAGRIIQNGIRRVVYRGEARDDLGAGEAFEMFADAGVAVIKLEGC